MADFRTGLHTLIDQLDHWIEVHIRFSQASCTEEFQVSCRSWLALGQRFWNVHHWPLDALCNLRGPAAAWCKRQGRDDPESFAVIEHAAQCVLVLAQYIPLSAFHYQRALDRNESRWAKQGQIVQLGRDAFAQIRRLADLIGEPWQRSDSAQPGTSGEGQSMSPPVTNLPPDETSATPGRADNTVAGLAASLETN